MKKYVYLSFLVLLSLMLVGCNNDENVIEFWTPLTGDDGAYMNQLVDDFNEQSDQEIEIKHVITSDMYTKLYTVMNSGSGIPDLTLIHADRVPSFVKQDLLKPMTGVMEAQSNINQENYLAEAWTAGEIDGTQYTIPLDIHGSAMYYNQDLLEKYGVENWLDDDVVTFDEMLSLEGQLEEGDYLVNDALMGWVILAQIQNLDGDIQENGEPAVNTPVMKEAIERVKEITDAGLMTPYGEDGYLMFQSGNVLFSTDGTWSSTGHAQVEGLNFGVTNIYAPSPDNFHNRASAHLFSMLNKEERSEEKEAVIADFLEYIRSHSIEWAEAGQIVASTEVVESPEYDEYMQSFFTKNEAEEESLHIYTYEHYPYIAEAIDTYIADLVHGEMEIDQGLEEMQKFVDDKVKEGTLDVENYEDTGEESEE
ncbi:MULTISPECIES: extracellular solute-binding protein [Oceanobacillus]|uniref:Extracellular solute-binding protein n=1 Tax=Oceanobacillus kimchii TaxID=746691 RepID=A0ABQ5THD1_9BACI|nr:MULTISPECIES: extracellular solute-binding protein [Oceanobacillus]MBT2599309.1 extracellular solute-binding protein [Oceanobacillus sp. ISL-74]MBT2652227.1 extracellular solute-binding protein [Oceanobacillus sp. ISL-73]MCT1578494.1 extracellular solute-binding protein [Oceanobacillus kimchii]MCT2136457.1 extracellular solute-binding protein [Oceanobacillus kimchii]OEH54135.1 ABC transporter substrate-binding protein [Oceanobacillus sp. E9]